MVDFSFVVLLVGWFFGHLAVWLVCWSVGMCVGWEDGWLVVGWLDG